MGKVYVASSLLNNFRARHFINLFKKHGHEVTYDWTTHGMVTGEQQLREVSNGERDGVLDADLLFVVFPARAGSHVELGIAIACNALGRPKPIILLFEEVVELKSFYFDDNVFRYSDESSAVQHALRILSK